MKTLEELKELNPNIEFNNTYCEIINELSKDGSHYIFVSGNAGSGKSTLLKTIIQMFDDKNVVTTATTGVASSLLGGNGVYATTIFRALRIPVKSVYDVTSMYLGAEQRRLLSNIDLLIIDEVSMLTVDLFEYIIAMFESVGHIPSIVMFGDILQLTPVVTKDVKKYYIENYQSNIYFFSSPIFDMYGFKSYILEKVYRQNDASFKDILNRLRENKLTDEDIKLINTRVATSEQIREWKNENKTNVTLASTNAIVQKMNEEILDCADGELYSLESKINGDFMKSSEFQSGRYPTEIKVKLGLPVMITANQKGVEIPLYVNGDIGILTEVNEDEGFVRVELKNGNVVELEMNKTESKQISFTMGDDGRIHAEETVTGSYENYPIVLYASSTFHKSQGCTLDKGIIYLNTSWYPENSLYVALSRFRSLDSFLLTHPLTKEMVSINKEASRFIEHMKKTVTSYEDNMTTKTVYENDVITEQKPIVRTPKENVLVNPITKIESEIENLSRTLNVSVEEIKSMLIKSWNSVKSENIKDDSTDSELVPF